MLHCKYIVIIWAPDFLVSHIQHRPYKTYYFPLFSTKGETELSFCCEHYFCAVLWFAGAMAQFFSKWPKFVNSTFIWARMKSCIYRTHSWQNTIKYCVLQSWQQIYMQPEAKNMDFLVSSQTDINFDILQAVTSHFHIASTVSTILTKDTQKEWDLLSSDKYFQLVCTTTSPCHISDFCMQSATMSKLKIGITVPPKWIWSSKHSISWKQIK